MELSIDLNGRLPSEGPEEVTEERPVSSASKEPKRRSPPIFGFLKWPGFASDIVSNIALSAEVRLELELTGLSLPASGTDLLIAELLPERRRCCTAAIAFAAILSTRRLVTLDLIVLCPLFDSWFCPLVAHVPVMIAC